MVSISQERMQQMRDGDDELRELDVQRKVAAKNHEEARVRRITMRMKAVADAHDLPPGIRKVYDL